MIEHRKLLPLRVCLALSVLLVIIAVRLPARVLGNWGMLSLARLAVATDDELLLATHTRAIFEMALQGDPPLARVSEARSWLKSYEVRALAAQRARAQLAQVQEAWQALGGGKSLTSQEWESLRVLAANTNMIESWLILAYLYNQRGDYSAFQRLAEQLKTRPPALALANTLELGGWRLEGYDWEPLSAGLYSKAHLVLYWHAVSGADESTLDINHQAGLYRFGRRLFQVLDAQNLLADGDFDWLYWGQAPALPISYHLMSRDTLRPDLCAFVADPEYTDNTILRVRNSERQTLLYAYPHLRKGATYLQVGRMRAIGGGVYGMIENLGGKNRFAYLAFNPKSTTWQAYAGTFTPQTVDGSIVILGTPEGPTATAEYDNLGLFELQLPFGS